MNETHLQEIVDKTSGETKPLGDFITTCPRCGGNLKIESYKLTYARAGRMFTGTHIGVCSDGFTICDDLRGTGFDADDFDQSTSDEVTVCCDCERRGSLSTLDTAPEQVLLPKDTIEQLIALIESIRPTPQRTVHKNGYDHQTELLSDLKAAAEKAIVPNAALLAALVPLLNKEDEESE